MEKEKSIHELDLHERISLYEFFVTRVPGGWIYHHETNYGLTAVFVPFNNEFNAP